MAGELDLPRKDDGQEDQTQERDGACPLSGDGAVGQEHGGQHTGCRNEEQHRPRADERRQPEDPQRSETRPDEVPEIQAVDEAGVAGQDCRDPHAGSEERSKEALAKEREIEDLPSGLRKEPREVEREPLQHRYEKQHGGGEGGGRRG